MAIILIGNGPRLRTWHDGVSLVEDATDRELIMCAMISGDRLAFDIMFDVVFGDKYEMVSKSENRPLLDAIATSSVRVGVMIQAPELRNRKIDKWLFPSSIAARGTFIAFVNKMLMNKSTEKEEPDRRNVFTILTSAKDPETGEGLRPSEIGAESTTLIVAGGLLN